MSTPSRPATRNVILILIGLAIAIVLPELPVQKFLPPNTTLPGQIDREIFFWAVTVLLVAYILLIERRPLSSIGLRWPTWKSFAFGIPAGILLVAGIVFIFSVVFPALHLAANQGAMQKLLHTPLWFRVMLVLRAAVFEEICYRGYSIERISEISGSRIIAALLSVAAFTYAHVGYWGVTQLIIAGFGGVVLTALYLWRRDLSSNMIAHFIADGAGFLFGGG